MVVGGGCVEAALSIYLENFATSLSSREQLAIADFAKSLLVIPKVRHFMKQYSNIVVVRKVTFPSCSGRVTDPLVSLKNVKPDLNQYRTSLQIVKRIVLAVYDIVLDSQHIVTF